MCRCRRPMHGSSLRYDPENLQRHGSCNGRVLVGGAAVFLGEEDQAKRGLRLVRGSRYTSTIMVHNVGVYS